MPSGAGVAGISYRSFAVRVVVMRVPWLAAALSAGALAARSLADIGHVAGIAGIVASAVVVAGLLAARHRAGIVRALSRRRGRSAPGLRRLRSPGTGPSAGPEYASRTMPGSHRLAYG
jgi:hypothetical protein